MDDTIDCPSCGRRLKLPGVLLGQDVRCPACDKVFTAAISEPPPAPPKSSPAETPPRRAAERERPRRFSYCPNCGARVEREARHCPDCEALLYLDDDEPRHCEPHRSGAILTLGILSALFGVLSLCFGVPGLAGLGFGIPAWAMAAHDIRRMRAGIMDRNGMANAQSGQSYAIVGVVLSMLCGGGWALLWLSSLPFR
jgi:uncharacterized paraquat-inducible protein A